MLNQIEELNREIWSVTWVVGVVIEIRIYFPLMVSIIDALRALHILSWILENSYEYIKNYVSGVSVEST